MRLWRKVPGLSPGVSATVYELTVADAYQLSEMGEVDISGLLEISPGCIKVAGNPTEEDSGKIFAEFEKLNGALFGKSKQPNKNLKPQVLAHLKAKSNSNFLEWVFALIELGHHNLWVYGYSAFEKLRDKHSKK